MATSSLHQAQATRPWIEPIEATRRLAARGALLLDGMGAHPQARWAHIGCSHRLEARLQDGRLHVRSDDGTEDVRDGPPLDLLRDLLAEGRFDAPAGTGGFVGYLGYAFTHAVEPTLPAPLRASTPDLCLRLCRDMVRFDRATGAVTVTTTDLPGEHGADARLQGLLADLDRDLAPLAPLAPQPADWTPSMDAAAFRDAVSRVRGLVHDGDLFQANIATRFQAPLTVDPFALYAAFQAHNPSPFMAFMDWGDHVLVSDSPEQLFGVADGRIAARPIAGTRRRGRNPVEDAAFEQELLDDAKEQAEHTMLVDLLRNDIARVSRPGTVHVPERGSVERYRNVMHLVSRVEGTLRPDTDVVDWLAALFPGGTITGAPKHRACLRIHEAETVARGPYTGSAGMLSWDQTATQWNILIRTMLLQDGVASVHAGSGIVAQSDPAREWKEAGHKAQALLDAATGAAGPAPHDLGLVTPHGDWSPPAPPGRVQARVLLVDNYDSFVHNLADHCAALGADVLVVRNDTDVDAALATFGPTHVILSPGPGWPDDAGHTLRLARDLVGRLPVLGVCLGHQALAQAAGATVHVHDEAVHGRTDQVHHDGTGLHAGLPSPLQATRYHSLVVDGDSLPDAWRVTARLADGTVMAMEHREHPAFGLQYHPESIGTPHGLDILIRFLSKT